jgi:hypothetical protein
MVEWFECLDGYLEGNGEVRILGIRQDGVADFGRYRYCEQEAREYMLERERDAGRAG